MPLSLGARLGAYEITDLLGTGGMGEVYRARDPRLKRDIALKILPPALATDPERRLRFEREAQAVAALNHPGIVTIYSVEQIGGHDVLTMELVEGRSLADLLPRQGLPLERFLPIAIPLADAVTAAHEKGITHRDLKPANVMVTPEGRVKVLDFGLAKLRPELAGVVVGAGGPGGADVTRAVDGEPTHAPLTGRGHIVGTFAYMSPEQAEGRPVDHRSDLFSLGIVLYEMATGVRPFTGESPVSVLAAIVKDTPSTITDLKPELPRDLARVIRKALAKDPRRRYQTAADLRNDLEELREEQNGSNAWKHALRPSGDTTTDRQALVVSRGPSKRWRFLVAVAGVAAVASALFWLTSWRSTSLPSAAPDPLTGATLLPDEGALYFQHAELALSPYADRIAYVTTVRGRQRIVTRRLDGSGESVVGGTEDGRDPVFSHDGHWLAFTAAGKLLKVPIAGGSPTRLADVAHMHGASWSADDQQIFYAPSNSGQGLWRVPAAGGMPAQVTTLDASRGDVAHEYPLALDDGRTLLFVTNAQLRPLDDSSIVAHRLDTGEQTVLVRNALGPRVTPDGYLLFMDRSEAMLAARLNDAKTGLAGAPVALSSRPMRINGNLMLAVASNGLGAWIPGPNPRRRTIAAIDANGRASVVVPDEREYLALAPVAPDGTTLAIAEKGGRLWVQRPGAPLSLVTAAADTGTNLVWFDRDTLLVRTRPGRLETVSLSGAAGAVLNQDDAAALISPLSCAAGRLLYLRHGTGRSELWLASGPALRDRQRIDGLSALNWTAAGSLDPAAALLAYQQQDSGRQEVFLRRLDQPEPPIQVSTAGGTIPVWSPDGRTLYFLAPGGSSILKVAVERDPLRVAAPVEARRLDRLAETGGSFRYQVHPDGRLLYIRSEEPGGDRILLRQHWRSLIEATPSEPR